MKGSLRIWTWGYPTPGKLAPVELEGLQDCTLERAKEVTATLITCSHWWIWIPPMNPRKAWSGGSPSLKAALRRALNGEEA